LEWRKQAIEEQRVEGTHKLEDWIGNERKLVSRCVHDMNSHEKSEAIVYPSVKDNFEGLGRGANTDFREVLGVQVVCEEVYHRRSDVKRWRLGEGKEADANC
jgi:hypothetical protein